MNSFGKDLLGFVFFLSWVLPTIALVAHLVISRVATLWRSLRARVPASRTVRVRALSERRPARIAPLHASGQGVSTTDRPRLGGRWKSSQRVTAGAC